MYHLLITDRTPSKARNLLKTLHRAALDKSLPATVGPAYRTNCKVLVMYGLGGPDRMPIGMQHIQSGKTLVTFDLGYWDRKLPLNYRKYRVAINGFHPREVMEGPRPSHKRWSAAGLDISDGFDPKGPIMLVGNAPKSVAVGANGWTEEKSRQIREAFPGAKIVYRPKPKRPHEPGVIFDELSTGSIDAELAKMSLVVCRHSNVAVDACRLGVPVVCDDGAAASIYPRDLRDYLNQPGYERRVEFLHRLAYWQWAANEAHQFWEWFLKTFPAYRY